MYKTRTFTNSLKRVWEAPGTLPDTPGWILGQNIKVQHKSKQMFKNQPPGNEPPLVTWHHQDSNH